MILNYNSVVHKTANLASGVQKTINSEGFVQKTISPESIVQKTFTGMGPLLQNSQAVLTGGGVLGVDVLGDFLLGDPAITRYIIWVTKKSVI
jgi:hypothetical protein